MAKLLHLMVHSVYSDRDVFLRELISNAADACDRMRYEAVKNPKLASTSDFKIHVTKDATLRILTLTLALAISFAASLTDVSGEAISSFFRSIT